MPHPVRRSEDGRGADLRGFTCFHLLTEPVLSAVLHRELNVSRASGRLLLYDIRDCRTRASLLRALRRRPGPSRLHLQAVPAAAAAAPGPRAGAGQRQRGHGRAGHRARSYSADLSGEQQIAMTLLQGDRCQLQPDSCWSRAALTTVCKPGLRCGGLLSRAMSWPAEARCPQAGAAKPLSFSAPCCC